MTSWSGDETPAGAGRDTARATPAGTTGEDERAAQRDYWRRVQDSYRRTVRGSGGRHRAARETLSARTGMIRIMPPGPPGGDAA